MMTLASLLCVVVLCLAPTVCPTTLATSTKATIITTTPPTTTTTKQPATTRTTNSPIVPLLYLSNISSNVPVVNANAINKVPSKRNVTSNNNNNARTNVSSSSYSASGGPSASTSSSGGSGSVYTPNYNSQQNVMQLVRNMDARLRNIRNVEMRVTAIQEIFDSMHFTSSAYTTTTWYNPKNSSSSASINEQQQRSAQLQQDLQLFSKRLVRKLQKASHVVLDLRDFFRYNITNFLMQKSHLFGDEYNDVVGDPDTDNDDDDIDDDENDNDDDAEDVDDVDFDLEIDEATGTITSEDGVKNMQLCLHTFVQPCQPYNDEEPGGVGSTTLDPVYRNLNYNKQQIQILNYLKTEHHHRAEDTTQTSDNDVDDDDDDGAGGGHKHSRGRHERYFEANAFIVEKIQALKNSLTSKADVYESRSTDGRDPLGTSNAKLKFLGNHLKHIYFLSRNDHAGDQSERFYYDMHFRHLYVSAIRGKYVVLLLDVGSAMTPELYELTKSYVSHVLSLLSATDLISIITVADEASSMLLNEAQMARRPHIYHNDDDDYPNDYDEASKTTTTTTSDDGYGIYHATRERKEEILNYITNLNTAKYALTNHSLAFEYAFRMLAKLQHNNLTMQPLEFVYVTRGLLSNLSEAMQVLNVIANGQRTLQQPIVINTCAVVLDEKRIMYEKQFLTDVSTQNYTKYDINVSDWLDLSATDATSQTEPHHQYEGKFFVLTKTHPDVVLRAATAIFERDFREPYLTETLEVHPPVVDLYSKDTLVSVTYAIPPYGVVGINMYLADLIEDVSNYQINSGANKMDYSYAFLMDRNGQTLAHPAFPRPNTQTQTPFPVDIGFLENSTDFTIIRRRMLHEGSGSVRTTVLVTQYKRSGTKTELLMMDRSYYWQSVLGIYVLCLVSTTKRDNVATTVADVGSSHLIQTNIQLMRYGGGKDKDAATMSQYRANSGGLEYMPAMDLLYHRLDLLPTANTHVCRYFRQIATMDAATLFLSASAFESPFTYLHNNRMSLPKTQLSTVETIMAYIKDSTGLLANPGLRPNIRREVNALYNAMQHLKKRHQDARGSMKPYIIRRYVATMSGVLQVYPGCLLSSSYDATRRPWFRKAMQQPGKIVTTEPYLDAGGAGYIITIAHTIFEGKSNALHSIERDQAVAIVALDLPYAYYYKMILDTTPLCQRSNIKCLLFENEGYLLAHPSMLEPSSLSMNPRRPHEHLTHKESYLANDILYHKHLVRKLACANYQNRTLQRYYVFNTSLAEILTNVVHGERTKYAISLIRGTNIFAAVLNSTNEGGAFCPCSTIDRTCLNCNRMDAHDCECPCECPMDMEVFTEMQRQTKVTAIFNNYTQQYAYCAPPSEDFVALPRTNADYSMLHMCTHSQCDGYGTQTTCLAVMGCEWCQQDLDGNGFQTAFCTAQTACFNGVLSSLSPYGDLDDLDLMASHGYNPSQTKNSYSAFGPVGGAIVVLVIVIGFAIYCYRHNLDANGPDQFYIDSMQEENYGLPLSRFNFDDCQANDDPPGGYDHPAAQRNLIHPADISPYHMSTGSSYRRPPNGESDHGYSTMTPHEDSSDHQCFTLAEPLLLNDKRHSKSDTLSISTSISSPTNRHQNHQYGKHKDDRYTATPKKFHMASPSRVYEQTTLPLHDANEECGVTSTTTPHYILAPVTVHRHMETSES